MVETSLPYALSGWGVLGASYTAAVWAWVRGHFYTAKAVRDMLDQANKNADMWREAYQTLRAADDLRDASDRQLVLQASKTLAQTMQGAQDRAEVPNEPTPQAT